ncbi:hypothetical protein Ddc_22140 [Ditylenchus destructor]|nr:hypothetical protein Ddc_22140 [Ditylenchus destructor]
MGRSIGVGYLQNGEIKADAPATARQPTSCLFSQTATVLSAGLSLPRQREIVCAARMLSDTRDSLSAGALWLECQL